MQISIRLTADLKHIPRVKQKMHNTADLFNSVCYMPHATGEDALANRVALELKALFQEGKLNCIWFHVPNETMVKTKHDFACLKKKQCMGMISGVPDFVFIKNDEPLTVLVELKTDKGKLSHNQKLFKTWCDNSNIPYEIARSWNDVKNALTQHGFVK